SHHPLMQGSVYGDVDATMKWLREAPILFVGFNEFRIFAGENGGGSFFHTIVTQIKQAEPNLKAEFVTQIGKEPESFGRELMLLALEKPAEEVLSFLGLHLDAIKQLPE